MGDAKIPAPATREIATTRDGRDITRGFQEMLGAIPSQDGILRQQGGSLRAYREVLRDSQVAACFLQRRRAVVATGWRVAPGEESRAGRKAAAFLEEQLRKIDFDGLVDKMLYGIFYGFSVAECLWEVQGERVGLAAVRVRNPERFGFDTHFRPLLRTTANLLGEEVPERKFWVFSAGADHDDEPYGLGLAHWLWWPVYFKRGGLAAWISFLDRFGSPTSVGKYPHGATQEEKSRLLETLQAIHSDSGVIIPEGMAIELLEAARSGRADFAGVYDRMEAAISKVILTVTMTTDDGSSLSQAQVHRDVARSVVVSDCGQVAGSFNAQISKWLTEWNFPGVTPPRVEFVVEEPEDLNQRSEREERIARTSGLKPSRRHVEEVYGGEWEVATGGGGEPVSDEAAPEFGEDEAFPDQEAVDRAAVALSAPRAQEAVEEMIAPLLARIRQGATPEEVMGEILDPALWGDTRILEELIARAAFAGEAWGGFHVRA